MLWAAALVLTTAACSDLGSRETVPVAVTVRAGTVLPLEGARVCETGTTNCALSDVGGNATIELPAGVETSYTIEKEGYGPTLIPDVVPVDGRTPWWGLVTVDRSAQIFESLMSPYPPRGTGQISITTFPPLEGVTFNLRGATAKLAYVDEVPLDNLEELYNLDLTATTSRGRGTFLEVSPGIYQVELGGTADDCVTNYSGWPGDAVNTVRVPVRDGFGTLVQMACSAP